ncbi:SapC family protein [Massilia soli]|uniref:SapC family protein n=1 Tax=Massilia soli TaxID=2792854 RepID=A0ABS7SJA9_9BURK|nr:SapC family protein [Massilia soli]MBZ2206288.1 SapC family protein [Massilia soli]
MANPVLLNNVDHKDLRVITRRGDAWGDNLMLAVTFPAEFRTLQGHYPIVFRKSNEGAFEPVALFGFQEGENLFLRDGRWDATDLPLSVERLPFMIGVSGQELIMHVDLDNPRVSSSEGEPVFLPHGGNTEFLERMNSTLLALHQGLQDIAGFTEALLQNELLESFVFDIELNDGSQNRLAGFYTINEDRLAALDGAVLERMNRAGYLAAVYFALASLSNFRALIERKNGHA